jgi:hypothetical protein
MEESNMTVGGGRCPTFDLYRRITMSEAFQQMIKLLTSLGDSMGSHLYTLHIVYICCLQQWSSNVGKDQ